LIQSLSSLQSTGVCFFPKELHREKKTLNPRHNCYLAEAATTLAGLEVEEAEKKLEGEAAISRSSDILLIAIALNSS